MPLIQLFNPPMAGWTTHFGNYKIACMGTSTRRYQPWGFDGETLEQYKKGAYALLARCLKPGCDHTRKMSVTELTRLCPTGFTTTLGDLRKRFRCHKCGSKLVEFKVLDGWRSRDGR